MRVGERFHNISPLQLSDETSDSAINATPEAELHHAAYRIIAG